MSIYGLIKATSRAMRSDTITDLTRINHWLYEKGMKEISSYGQSVRALENSVALGIENVDKDGIPKLERGKEFYESILPEIKDKERNKFNIINK